MQTKALGVLAVAIVAVIILTLMVGFGGGIDRRTRAVATAEIENMRDASAALERERASLERYLSDEPELFAADGSDTAWRAVFERAQSELDTLRSGTFAEMEAVLATKDSEQSGAVQRLAAEVAARRASIMAEVGGITADAARVAAFKKEMAQVLEATRSAVATVGDDALSGVQSVVSRAKRDWPEQRADLERRIASIGRAAAEMRDLWEQSSEARSRADSGEATPADIRLLADRTAVIQRLADEVRTAPKELEDLAEQLYVAWDKVLTDVVIEEGSEVRFNAIYKRVSTRVEPGEAGAMGLDAGVTLFGIAGAAAVDAAAGGWGVAGSVQAASGQPESVSGGAAGGASGVGEDGQAEVWEEVLPPEPISQQQFESLKNNVGMSVAHKPAGSFDHEAEQLLQPAGYAYIAEPGEANRYGRWENRGGTSMWVWYGQYALMRDLFWGPRWRVDRNDWSGYNRARSSGRTYYGDGKYGSTGSATTTSYAGSRYVSSGGFRNSKYVQSGGTYRGSRYESRSTVRSAGSSRSGGYNRSGSRSSGK